MLRGAVLALSAALAFLAAADETVFSVRVYPGPENTRLILESGNPISHSKFRLEEPSRLVFDIHSETGDRIVSVVNASDTSQAPYISSLRAARNSPKRLRVVFDLAAEVDSNVFLQDPVGQYQHRLIIDVIPKVKPDPLRVLLERLSLPDGEVALPPEMPRDDYIRELLVSLDPFIVVIDPGHGGDDPGAVAVNKAREKDIVLDIAVRIGRQLEGYSGINAFLTREGDYFVPLSERVRKAHRLGADLFVSIHADAFHSPQPKGTSVYMLSKGGASSRLARQLARQENLSDLIGGVDTEFVVRDGVEKDVFKAMSFDGKQHASRLLGDKMRMRLADVAVPHGNSIEAAGFAVLKSPSIPSILVETGFLSNPDEANLLTGEDYRQRMAESIASAIADYHTEYHRRNALVLQ